MRVTRHDNIVGIASVRMRLVSELLYVTISLFGIRVNGDKSGTKF